LCAVASTNRPINASFGTGKVSIEILFYVKSQPLRGVDAIGTHTIPAAERLFFVW